MNSKQMTLIISEENEEDFPGSFAVKKKASRRRSMAPITPTTLTRSDISSSNELISESEFDSSSPSRSFDFPIHSLQTNRYISKSHVGNEFSEVKYLGTGSNSMVFTAKRNDEMVVLKMLKQNLHHRNIAELEMKLEMQILTKTNHPNIIGIKGAGEIPRKFIVVDYLEGGTLDKLLQQNQPLANPQHQQSKHKKCSTGLPISTALSIARDLASALKYLHDDVHPNATVIHRDLKPQNIGFTADRQLKLFDFGLVTCVKKCSSSDEAYMMSGFTGTMAYMAPEVALRKAYNEKVDVYSFGILLWQMLSGEVPFAGLSRDQFMERVACGGQRPALSAISQLSSLPEGLTRLMEQCWHASPSQRPSCASIVLTLDAIIHNIQLVQSSQRLSSLWSQGLSLFKRSSRKVAPTDSQAVVFGVNVYVGNASLKGNASDRLPRCSSAMSSNGHRQLTT